MAMTRVRPHPQVGEFALHMGDLLEGGVDRVDAKVEFGRTVALGHRAPTL
jgi:hypothetical protein